LENQTGIRVAAGLYRLDFIAWDERDPSNVVRMSMRAFETTETLSTTEGTEKRLKNALELHRE
jgi:hypothetical protein